MISRGDPAGGGTLRKLGPVEFIISAGPGGKGTVWLEDFRFCEPHEPQSTRGHGVQQRQGVRSQTPCSAGKAASGWRSAPRDLKPWLQLDFHQAREYGGLVIEWEPRPAQRAFAVQASDDGRKWRAIHRSRCAEGVRSFIYLPKENRAFFASPSKTRPASAASRWNPSTSRGR